MVNQATRRTGKRTARRSVWRGAEPQKGNAAAKVKAAHGEVAQSAYAAPGSSEPQAYAVMLRGVVAAARTMVRVRGSRQRACYKARQQPRKPQRKGANRAAAAEPRAKAARGARSARRAARSHYTASK